MQELIQKAVLVVPLDYLLSATFIIWISMMSLGTINLSKPGCRNCPQKNKASIDSSFK
jgi:hypothetical protein